MHRTNETCGFPAHTGSLHRAEKMQFINITDQLCSRHPPCAGWYLIGLGCQPPGGRLSDPDDDMVLETAINGSASAIVTFNQRDFVPGIKGFRCAVILPAMALQQIRRVLP